MTTPGRPAASASRKIVRSCGVSALRSTLSVPSGSEAIVRDAPVQRAARQPERLRGAAHVAFVPRQRFLNEHFLNILERQILEPRGGAARRRAQAEVGGT